MANEQKGVSGWKSTKRRHEGWRDSCSPDLTGFMLEGGQELIHQKRGTKDWISQQAGSDIKAEGFLLNCLAGSWFKLG